MESPSRRWISKRYLIRRVPNEQAALSINAHNQGGRRTGPRTNLTRLQIGSAFSKRSEGHTTAAASCLDLKGESAEETDDPSQPLHLLSISTVIEMAQ